MQLLFYYLIIINAIGMSVMYIDKQKAIKGEYRIPEATLWKIAFVGGAIGTTLGMKIHRHKTKHNNFKYGFPTLAFIECIGIIYLFFVFTH